MRVVELGNIQEEGREKREQNEVERNRIKELEKNMGVRILKRKKRKMKKKENGRVFYDGELKIIEEVDEEEEEVEEMEKKKKGQIRIKDKIGLGRRIIEQGIKEFKERYKEIEVRIRI